MLLHFSIWSLDACENNPLGVEDSLPDSSFSASSFFEPSFSPSSARLNGEYAWCSGTEDVSAEYLQIQLPYGATICAIATQGTGFKHLEYTTNESVTEYSVEYFDGGRWKRIEKVTAIHVCPYLEAQSFSNRSNH